jgi:phosphatidylserine decarboxylase
MLKKYLSYSQFILPQHLLTKIMGCLTEARQPWLKSALIRRFIKHYSIHMQEAVEENPQAYATFNDFFIRQLKPTLRPLCTENKALVAPADGCIAQIGQVRKNQLLQAKQFYFDLETLLGNDHALAQTFYDGLFTTIYLAPHNYHRVHMPLTGKLVKTIYIPGNLFSVNHMTSQIVPQLYSRNERLICIFTTAAGYMAVILVGALIVGSIQTIWMEKPIRASQPIVQTTYDLTINKGEELGYFKLGSTVILLFEKDKIAWLTNLTSDALVEFGQQIGTTC